MSKLSGRFQSNLLNCLIVAIVGGGAISCGNENVPPSSVDEPIGEVSIGVKLSKLAAATMVRAEVVVTAVDMDTICIGQCACIERRHGYRGVVWFSSPIEF